MAAAFSRSWLVPRKDDRLNFWLWRLSPWLAGAQWSAVILSQVFQLDCGGPDTASGQIVIAMATILTVIGLRGLAWGGASHIGALVLTVTNGGLLLLITAIVGPVLFHLGRQ